MNNKIKLIVTDDASEFTQENLNILQSKNISVIFCAKDGEELCDKIKRESPDVVLMDSFMTRLDAIGVMRSITRESTKVPVFMVYSSFHSTVLEREIMNSGASYFVFRIKHHYQRFIGFEQEKQFWQRQSYRRFRN